MQAKDVVKGKPIYKVFEVEEIKDTSEGEDKALTFTITSDRRDRDRDIVSPTGIMAESYAQNPVMLWAHQYDQLPIGRSVQMWADKSVKNGEVSDHIKARVIFQPDENYHSSYAGIRGSMVYRMYQTGFMNAVSIGFDPLEWEDIEEKDSFKGLLGTRFTKFDLLEFSAVPVPSNPEALVDRKMRKMFMKSLKSWANETIKQCDVCAAKGNHSHEFEKQEAEEFLRIKEDESMEKSITDTDKSDLQAAINKENLQDLSAYHRRLHQQAAQGNVLTGFSKSDMSWLHAQIEGKMCDLHKAQDPPTKCADPSPLDWGKEGAAEIAKDQSFAKCAHITEVTGRIADRERNSGKAVSNNMGATKQGRVLSSKNEQDLRDAVDHHTAGVKLTNNVLGQVTNTPTQGSSAEPPTSWDYDAEANQGGASEAGSGADAANPGITKAHVNTGDCLGCPNFDDANVVCKKDLDPATCGLANLYNEGLKSMTEEKAPTAPNPGDCGNCTGDNFNGGKCDVGKSPDTCGMTKSMKQPTKPNPGDCGKCVGDHFGGGKCEVGKSPDNCGETGASKSMTPVDVIGAAIGKAVVDYLKNDKTAKTVTNAATDDELFEVDEDMLNDVLTTEFGLDGAESAE